MSAYPITCAGPHTGGTPLLGSVELGDGASPAAVAAATAGYLCPDCGDVYEAAVATRGHRRGAVPGVDLVNDLLPKLRPAGYWPKHPPGPPSWAPAGRPWPYPTRPGNVPTPT